MLTGSATVMSGAILRRWPQIVDVPTGMIEARSLARDAGRTS
jgi:hypothetical protein